MSSRNAAKRAADAATKPANGEANGSPKPEAKSEVKEEPTADGNNVNGGENSQAGQAVNGTANGASAQPPTPRQPWELVDEIMSSLKTQFPLLTLTMEKMVDQISIRAKPSSDEDIYRFFAALLADALQVSSIQAPCSNQLRNDSNGSVVPACRMTMVNSAP